MTDQTPAAPAPQPGKTPMSTGKKVGIGCAVIFVLFAGGCGILLNSAKDAAQEITGSVAASASSEAASLSSVAAQPPITVTSKQLIDDYGANELAADQKYKGKNLEVTGVVQSVSEVLGYKTLNVAPSSDDFASVKCPLKTEAAINKAITLAKGDPVTVVGIGDGYDIEPNLKACEIR